MTPRERAWADIHHLLPDDWRASAASYSPATRTWSVSVYGPKPPQRIRPPEVMTGRGEDELAALTYLAIQLRERWDARRLEEIGRRARLAYIQGAEKLAGGARAAAHGG